MSKVDAVLGFVNPDSFYGLMNKQAQRVIEWNKTFRNGDENFTYKDKRTQTNLVIEEADELLKALNEDDVIETIDAICDLFVVASYLIYIHNKNKNVWDFIRDKTSLVVYKDRDDIETEIDNLCCSITDCDTLVIPVNVEVILNLILSLPKDRDYLTEVLESNDSKFLKVSEYSHMGKKALKEMLEAECHDIEVRNEFRYTGVKYYFVGDYIVFRDSNGKLMKPFTFHPPKFNLDMLENSVDME